MTYLKPPPVLPPSAPHVTNYWVVPGYDTTNNNAFRCWCYTSEGVLATDTMDCISAAYPTDFLSLTVAPQTWAPSPAPSILSGEYGFTLVAAVAQTLSEPNVLGEFYAASSLLSGTSSPPVMQVVLPVLPGTQRRGVILVFSGKDAATGKTVILLASKDPEIKNSTGGSDGA